MEQHLERCRSCFSRVEFEKRLKAYTAELRPRAGACLTSSSASARCSTASSADAMVYISCAKRNDLRRDPCDVHGRRARSRLAATTSRSDARRARWSATGEQLAGCRHPPWNHSPASAIHSPRTSSAPATRSSTSARVRAPTSLLAAQAVGPSGQVIGARPHGGHAREARGKRCRGWRRIERARAGRERRAAPAARRLGRCGHEQRRPQPRAGQARGVRGNPPRAEAGRTPADR